MKTILELAIELDDRGLTAMIGQTSEGWVVWLYPADDLTLGIFMGTSDDLATAIDRAFTSWNGLSVS